MSKYYDILIDGKFQLGFKGSEEIEAIDFYNKTAQKNPKSLVKMVMHRRTDVRVFRDGVNKVRNKNTYKRLKG